MTFAGLLFAALITPPVMGEPEAMNPTDLYAALFVSLGVRDEPSVAQRCKGGLEIIRFIDVVDSSPRRLIRIERLDGAATMTVRNFPEAVAGPTRPVSDAQWEAVILQMQTAGFWGAGRDRTGWFPGSATWIFETCVAGRYHNVRYYPDRNLAMRDTVTELSRLLQ